MTGNPDPSAMKGSPSAPLRARSLAELHLFLDLAGLPHEREHGLVEERGELVAVYAGRMPDGRQAVFRFHAVSDGGEEAASVLIDAGQYHRLARELAQRVPADIASLPPAERSTAMRDLQQAIAYLDEVLLFLPRGAERAPEGAFWTRTGRDEYARRAAAFDAAMLHAVRRAWSQRLHSVSLRPSSPAQPFPALAAALAERARPLLAALRDDPSGAVMRSLVPQPADYAQVFLPSVAAAAQAAYAAFWPGLPPPQADAGQTEIQIVGVPAAALADDNPLSEGFPLGYRAIAPLLAPDRIWLRWRYARPAETAGLALDGLVWLDTRWAWFPKPYRVLHHLAGERPGAPHYGG